MTRRGFAPAYQTVEEAVHALQEALDGVDNPTSAARALADVGKCFRPEHHASWEAFRREAEKLLARFFGGKPEKAKPTVWAVLDVAGFGKLASDRRDRSLEIPSGAEALPRARVLAEILEDPAATAEPERVVPRLAWAGRSTLLAAREKLGKSTLAAAAASAVSQATRFLGEPCRKGAVLWIGLEEHMADTARRFVKWGADPDTIHLLDRVREDPFGVLGAEVARLEPALIVVDTLAAFLEPLGLEPGNASRWTTAMAHLIRIARDSGGALLIVHHGSKHDGTYRDSTAIGASVDVIIEMSKGDDASKRHLAVRGRWSLSPFTVRLVVGGDSKPQFELDGVELSLGNRIVLAVEREPGLSKNDVARRVRGKTSQILDEVKRLVDVGRLEDRGTCNRSSLYPGPFVGQSAGKWAGSTGETAGETVTDERRFPGAPPTGVTPPKETRTPPPAGNVEFADLESDLSVALGEP